MRQLLIQILNDDRNGGLARGVVMHSALSQVIDHQIEG
jgi:hypothetical protein